jgi:chaperonin cofactor prefoldin
MTVVPFREKSKVITDAQRACEKLDLEIWTIETQINHLESELMTLRMRRSLYTNLLDSVRMTP